MLLGGAGGLVVGAVIGFGVALAFATPRNDGTYGMREIIVCLPIGALLGLIAGVFWGVRTRLGG